MHFFIFSKACPWFPPWHAKLSKSLKLAKSLATGGFHGWKPLKQYWNLCRKARNYDTHYLSVTPRICYRGYGEIIKSYGQNAEIAPFYGTSVKMILYHLKYPSYCKHSIEKTSIHLSMIPKNQLRHAQASKTYLNSLWEKSNLGHRWATTMSRERKKSAK